MDALPEPLTDDALAALGPAVRHGFFTRLGGQSAGLYQSLNTGPGSDDDAKTVAANRRQVCRALGSTHDAPLTVHQIHSADVVVADGPWQGERPKADGIVTTTPGLAIGILTADCGPVLFADVAAGVVGAAHAGWQGALNGVLENTIEVMIEQGAGRKTIVAALGPCIAQKNYEVGSEYFTRFMRDDEANVDYFEPSQRETFHMFDLGGYIVGRLRKSGVAVSRLDRCTYGEDGLFYSYRRSVHRNEPDYGRQISAIMLSAGEG